MKKLLKIIIGFNAVSLIHLFRCNWSGFVRACNNAFAAAFHALHSGFSMTDQYLPQISLDVILGDRVADIVLHVTRCDDGMLPNEQRMALLSILVVEAPSRVLEIGTFMGNTTRQMAENLPGAIIHTVDLPEDFSFKSEPIADKPKDDFHLIDGRCVGRDFKGHPCEVRIRQHFADTATWSFEEAENSNFFFIDGSHTYEYCKSDSEKCYELCAGNGVFLWHDCDDGHPGVVKLLVGWRKLGRDIRRISGTPMAYWKSS